jgi:hypothetical protein
MKVFVLGHETDPARSSGQWHLRGGGITIVGTASLSRFIRFFVFMLGWEPLIRRASDRQETSLVSHDMID